MEKAVMQSLASALGAADSSTASTVSSDGTAATDSSASTTDAQGVDQAFGSFMQSLMGAMHAQGSGSASGTSASEQEGGDAVQGARRGPPPGGGGRMESDLQSLVQALSASSGTTGSSDTADSSSDSSATSDSDTSDLQAKFKDLLSALGAPTDNSDATLNSFLQALQSNMGSATHPAGNAVDTTA
jgi:hypothetical protein